MKFSDWEPIYNQILSDFNYDRNKDEEAANILKNLLKQKEILPIDKLSEVIKDKELYIIGAGPDIKDDIANLDSKNVIIAADGAASPLIENGMVPDIIVTDLDGFIPDQIKANEHGAMIIVHAHGDNIPAIKRWVPKFEKNLLGTTQAKPDEINNLYNFGGFTDGDRAVFLGAHFQARIIKLIAFDFKSVGKSSHKYNLKIKLKKLTWANLLIGMVQDPPVIFQKEE